MVDIVLIPVNMVQEDDFVEGYSRVSEVAKRLNTTTRTVTRWLRKGYFEGVIKNDPEAKFGSYYMIPDSSVEDFMERQKTAIKGNRGKS